MKAFQKNCQTVKDFQYPFCSKEEGFMLYMMCPLIWKILFNIQIKKYICVTNVCSSGFLYTLISVCFPQLFDVLTPFQGKKMKILSIYISPRDLKNICVQRYRSVAESVLVAQLFLLKTKC